jgi:spore coat protein H
LPAALLPAFALLAGVGCRTPVVPWDSSPDTIPSGDTDTTIIRPSWAPLVINEFLADNSNMVADGTGAYSAWIELYNPSSELVSLDGWALSDDHGDPTGSPIEQLVIEPWSFLLFWADGEPSLGPDHLDFVLDPQGGEIGLFAPDRSPIDGLTHGPQVVDLAAARSVDGGGPWQITASPTPGSSNGTWATAPGGSWLEPPAPCELVSDLEQHNFLEGDLVTLRPRCAGELGDDALLEPVSLPADASWDGSVFSWPTGPDSGGRVDLAFSILTDGDEAEIPSAEAVTFWVADDPSADDNVPPDPRAYTEEWGLPVLHAYTWSEIGTGYVAAELGFGGLLYPGMIKIRGATSASYPKPGYTLEFNEAELPIPAWGVSRDHLVLVSPFDDNSYVRQKLIYDQWAAIAGFWGEARLTPRSFFVVLYFDGVYQGLFMALDRVDNEFLEQQGFDRDANLYKAVNHDANYALTDSGGNAKDTLHDGFEKKEGEPEDDFSDLDALVAFTGHADAQGLVDGAEEWIHLEEFMDWFLLVHYSHSEDSAGKNAYLASSVGDPWFRYVPWDFNHSWGQDWRTYRESSSSRSYFTGNNRVFWAIQDLEATDAQLWERYRLMAQPGGPFDPDWLRAQVDAYYALIEASAQRDWDKWAMDYYDYDRWKDRRNLDADWTDYQGEKRYLYQWLDERAALFEELR